MGTTTTTTRPTTTYTITADVSSKKQIEFFEGLTSSADTHHSGATKKKEKQRFGLNIFNRAAPTSSRNPTPRNDRKGMFY